MEEEVKQAKIAYLLSEKERSLKGHIDMVYCLVKLGNADLSSARSDDSDHKILQLTLNQN